MEESIFTKIIKGEIPSNKVYEDDKTFAFLDIHPLADGHTLVVPKTQVEFIWDLPAEDYQALMTTVQKVGRRLRDVMDAPYVGVEVIGVDVPHAHVHVVPFTTTDELRRKVGDDEPDYDKLARLAEKIRFDTDVNASTDVGSDSGTGANASTDANDGTSTNLNSNTASQNENHQ
jgi:histidine triad (HIT) family protein